MREPQLSEEERADEHEVTGERHGCQAKPVEGVCAVRVIVPHEGVGREPFVCLALRSGGGGLDSLLEGGWGRCGRNVRNKLLWH